MQRFATVCVAASLASLMTAPPGIGAARNMPDVGTTAARSPAAAIVEHQLDVEMTVHNWVLCASQDLAEKLVRACQAGREQAARAFADLETAHSCGRLAEMHVILQEPLYEALLQSGGSAKVYGALVNISGAWASGFVVYGGLPDDRPR